MLSAWTNLEDEVDFVCGRAGVHVRITHTRDTAELFKSLQ